MQEDDVESICRSNMLAKLGSGHLLATARERGVANPLKGPQRAHNAPNDQIISIT